MTWRQTAGLGLIVGLLGVPSATQAQSPPQMRLGSISTAPSGHLSASSLRAGLQQLSYALKTCYSKRLGANKNLSGTVVAKFTISRSGQVIRSRASGIKHDVAPCVARTIATMRLPKQTAVISATVSIRFYTGSGMLGLIGHSRIARYRKPLRRWRSIPRVHKLSSTAGLHKTIVRRYVLRNRRRFARCHERKSNKSTGPKGRAHAEFIIRPNGRVSGAKVIGPVKTVAACIRRRLAFVRFPRPKRAVKVSFSLSFKRRRGGAVTSSLTTSGGVYGGLMGKAPKGGYGFGRGKGATGPGGGGTGWGTIGTGKYGTIGHGRGVGSGYGVSGARRGKSSAKLPKVHLGKLVRKGSLHPAIIRRYLRRKRHAFARCWKVWRPGTRLGKASVSFTIGASGRVTRVAITGVGTGVHACMYSTLKSIKFPKPRGGGIVTVSFPSRFIAPPLAKQPAKRGRGGYTRPIKKTKP